MIHSQHAMDHSQNLKGHRAHLQAYRSVRGRGRYPEPNRVIALLSEQHLAGFTEERHAQPDLEVKVARVDNSASIFGAARDSGVPQIVRLPIRSNEFHHDQRLSGVGRIDRVFELGGESVGRLVLVWSDVTQHNALCGNIARRGFLFRGFLGSLRSPRVPLYAPHPRKTSVLFGLRLCGRRCRQIELDSRLLLISKRRQSRSAQFFLVPVLKAQPEPDRRRAISESRAQFGHPDGRSARVREVKIIHGIVRRYPWREHRDEHVYRHHREADHAL